ncbi:eukaryotic translation initiation factor 4G [Striga asiatica]|uniref:Eukaryotic translation initiation factor 4G n=1 Tax=Striga asiatica TaxID=4170 RepID=A0A5A7PVS4_STRAF|nr:eukaryotic translation initiation factor 4G [Striga asiatica]
MAAENEGRRGAADVRAACYNSKRRCCVARSEEQQTAENGSPEELRGDSRRRDRCWGRRRSTGARRSSPVAAGRSLREEARRWWAGRDGASGERERTRAEEDDGVRMMMRGTDDNVCEDSTDEEYIIEESFESDGLGLDEIESCQLDALGQLSGEEWDQFIDNFHEDSTDEEYVPEEESSESDGLNSSELGTDDEEYFEARRKRVESKKVADEETENFTLSSEKGLF